MTEEIPDILIPPHVKEAVADHNFFEGFKKAFGVDDKPPLDTLDDDGDDDVSLPQAMWGATNPGELDPETDPGDTAHSSLKTALHLCGAKLALLGGDSEAAHRHVNAAIKSFMPVHAAAYQRVAETDLHSRSAAD
jgi:hypothetical protein